MASITDSELLKDREILKEINRYKWLESEKAGHDIGFEKAARDWINSYAHQYLTRHPNKTALLWLKSQPLIKVLNTKVT